MTYNYRVIPTAEYDLESALSWYYDQGGQSLRKRFFNAYEQVRDKVCTNPEIFSFSYKNYRGARFKKFPYKIIYKIRDDDIFVLAIAHDKRHPDYWKHRIN